MLITKKDKSIATKMSARFMENSTFGVLSSAGLLIIAPFVLIILILAGIFGLGIIAWPALVIFVSTILLTLALIVCGIFIGNYVQDNKESVKEKLKNFIDKF